MHKSLTTIVLLAAAQVACADPVLPGYLTDPSAMKDKLSKDDSYQPPEAFKYPYISTYYVKPTVAAGESVKVGFFVTDFESSKIRFLDDSHRFAAFLEYRPKGGASKTASLKNIKSGDAEFDLGKLPAGEYEMRIWAVDAKGRESHRVIHDFRVVSAADLAIPADKVYRMSEADLAKYGIRNDGDVEKVVYVETNGTSRVVREKRSDIPGYTVTVPMDPKTGKLPWQAWKQAKIVYDAGYDKAAAETAAVATTKGLQKLLDEKAAEGIRKFEMLPGTYRLSWTDSVFVPSHMTLDLGKAVLKQNGFTGAGSVMVRLSSVVDAHLVGGTLEGDYWEHNYGASPSNSEWPAGFEIGGDTWYSSVEGVKVVDITGYGGQNGIRSDSKGWLSFFYDTLPKFAPGGLDARTGEVDASDKYRFTTDYKDIGKAVEKGRRRLQVSRHLGYQGLAARSWHMTVAWYDAGKKFISAETSWQYREMWIPDGAAFIRVSVEAADAEAADKSGLSLTAFRLPVNCEVKDCRFEHCRCVGYAASAMKNMLFERNFFTLSGESAACCAFDAEDGWDQMQDVYFLKNVFRDNPRNNSILTCAGHNFILEQNDCDVYFWGRTHSPCVRGNTIGEGTYFCDSRLRSGYGRFVGNAYAKAVHFGMNEIRPRPDNWDYVVSSVDFDGTKSPFGVEVGPAGRVVNCSFRQMPISVANAYACTFDACTDGKFFRRAPSGRWFEVAVKGSKLSRFCMTNYWDCCHFSNAKLNNLGGRFEISRSDFTDSSLFGLASADLRIRYCGFEGTTVQGNYWERPADIAFANCGIKTKDDAPFLRLGGYTVGRVGFDRCTVSGAKELVSVFDVRSISLPPNVPPEGNPDNLPGIIAIRRTQWEGESKAVLTRGKDPKPSPKKIIILDKGNAWPDGVAVAEDILPTWELKHVK